MTSIKKGQWTNTALKILKERYLQKNQEGVQETPEEMIRRVADAIAQGDSEYNKSGQEIDQLAESFYDLMSSGKFLPNSPTLMNAGLNNDLQYSACYVLPVEDSVEGIFNAVKNAVIIHRTGGGTGFSFSRLRPKGTQVKSSGGIASGPVSFMSVFDSATEVIKQGGRRRGANMGVLRVDHPDIEEFITCKLEGGITNFNISVAITEAFLKALENNSDYELKAQPGWQSSVIGVQYKGGEQIGHKSARKVFSLIVDAAWKSGDPGLVFIDRINDSPANPIPELKTIEACNPCGEQFLFPNDACNLGSINLLKFTNKDSTSFDWDNLAQAVRTAIHFLDNVITVNPYPLPAIDKVVKNNRRIGLGIMGWADVLFTLGIPYDSDKALSLASDIMEFIKCESWHETMRLAQERGPFPNWKYSIYKDASPIRNSNLTAIAPTGSISIIAGVSSGIEPAFGISYQHVVKQPEGSRLLTFVNPIFEQVAKERGFWSKALMDEVLKSGSVQGADGVPEDVQKVFVTAHEVEPHWHIRMQAAFQKHTDNGVSKTVNLPNDATRQDVEDVYLLAYKTGCLGVTAFRDRCKWAQVLNIGIKETQAVEETTTLPLKIPKVRPAKLNGTTYRKKTPVGVAYITVNFSDGDREPFEVFINVGKAGSAIMANAEGFGRLISLILRLPGPLSSYERAHDIVGQLRGIGSGRSQGFGNQRVMSLADAVAQAIAEHIGLEATGGLNSGLPDMEEVSKSIKIGDLCPECGQATFVYEEGCQKCYHCGFSEC